MDISVIIVNYNTSRLCIDCIRSIQKFETSKDIEFIVVDNASRDEETRILKNELSSIPGVKLIFSRLNLGFSGGNMLGFQKAEGNNLAFINSDVIFVEPVFEKLITHFSKFPQTGVCGPQILDENQKESISFRPFEGLRYKIFGKKFLAATQASKPKMWEKQNQPIKVDFVIGSFMFFDKNAFCEVGGFDTNIFLYYEEMDICYRLKKKAYHTYFVPSAKYIHLEGKSSNRNLDLKWEHLLSYLYVCRKNLGLYKYFIIKTYLLICYALKAPFKQKNRFVFKRLLSSSQSLSGSLRHRQIAKKNMDNL
ncbi:MAG TPA: glycosyltransferase family 2 protein [Flavobacteriaceae bacterium]|nr:glycosyltransferase family 2 protein [Flavobacteriaceae bacterium]